MVEAGKNTTDRSEATDRLARLLPITAVGRRGRIWNEDKTESMKKQGLPEENAENRARDGNLAQGTLHGIKPESRMRSRALRRLVCSLFWRIINCKIAGHNFACRSFAETAYFPSSLQRSLPSVSAIMI